MLTLIENEFVVLHFNAHSSMLQEDWKSTSDYMTDEEFMQYQEQKLKVSQEIKPQLLLADNTEFLMTVAPELQVWTNKHILIPQIKLGLERVAMIRSTDLFSQISLEQMMAEERSQALAVEYFNSLQEAQNWLDEALVTS